MTFKKRNYKYKCSDFSIEIFTVFGTDISSDVENVHPKDMCHKCYKLMKRTMKANNVDAMNKLRACFSVTAWSGPYDASITDPSQCEVCARLARLLSGGKKRKVKASASAPTDTTDPRAAVNGMFSGVIFL